MFVMFLFSDKEEEEEEEKQRFDRVKNKETRFSFFLLVKSILPETASILESRLLPPSEQQLCLLRKILAAGMVDRLAKYVLISPRKLFSTLFVV